MSYPARSQHLRHLRATSSHFCYLRN